MHFFHKESNYKMKRKKKNYYLCIFWGVVGGWSCQFVGGEGGSGRGRGRIK